jgi:ubiquinone/menaquinone biosynthesis C-methylase UbiE
VEQHRDELVAAQYFVAVAGLAALRQCLDRPSAVRPRLDDVAAVVEHLDEFPNSLRIPVVEHDVGGGYAAWAPRYDGPNPATALDDEVVGALLAEAPTGIALDAACGTGRHARRLAELGHRVVGVDASEAMLAVAAAKVPDADLRVGTLDALPLDDDAVDLAVCSLALTHVEDLAGAVREIARVVRPGGTVVLSDMHPYTVLLGGVANFPGDGERFELHHVVNELHPVSAYVDALLGAGLEIRRCLEPLIPAEAVRRNPAHSVLPDAVEQAFTGTPFLLVWQAAVP